MLRCNKIFSSKNFQLKVFLVLVLFSFSNMFLGQSIWNNPITGTNPNTANPYTTGQTVDADINVSGILRGPSITGTNANDRYNATSWNTGALDLNDYFEFTLTPCLGSGSINFVSFVYTGQASSTGPTNFAIRSSLDLYVANIGVANASGTSISLSGALYQNITSPITFRYYAWGGTGGTYSINSFTFNGTTTSCGGCVSPTITTQPTSVSTTTSGTASYTVVASGTTPTYQWQENTGSGFLNITNGGTNPTYAGSNSSVLTISNPPLSMSGYSYQCVVTNTCPGTATSNTATLSIITCVTPSISPSSPYTSYVTPAQTSTFVVTATGTPSSYQWQVNAGSGYSAISNGGVYSGATTSLLTVSNPPTSMNSYSYQCVVSYSCGSQTSTTGILNVNDATSANCPRMTGVLVNSCTGSCQEGDNEILFFNSGTSSIAVTPANIVVTYGSTVNPTTTYADSFTSNATKTANLNSLASSSCTTLFVDASAAGTIPANSVFMIARNSNCFDYDLSSFCSLGTIYVLYSTDASWTVGGNFSNGGNVGELRFFTANFNAVSGGCTTSYNYQPNLLVAGDGAGIAFPVGGGAANTYFNNGCNPPLTILPIELIDFYATKNNDVNDIFWKVGSEENVMYYTIDKSNNGIDFKELTTVFVNSNAQTKTYNVVDQEPFSDITYYRLGTKEKNGKDYFYKIISVNEKSDDWKSNHYQHEQNLVIEFKNSVPKHSTISLFDLSGKLVVDEEVNNSQTKINVQNFTEGIYFVRITTPYKTENFKIIIIK